jgi:hypothetical protein
MLSLEFIGGYLSAVGSFISYKRKNNKYFGFQIKSTTENTTLLEQICTTLEIPNQVYKYKQYSLLIIRNRHFLEKNLFPMFDLYLDGEKKNEYLKWKEDFYNNSSTWNHRMITTKL